MRKKSLIAVAIAAALVAMPVVAGAGSPGDYDNTDASTTTTQSTTTNAGVASGTTVTVPSAPVVQVAANGEKTTVAAETKDATGTTVGLVTDTVTSTGVPVTSNAAGELVIGNVTVGVATGEAETAGLPEETKTVIQRLNSSEAASSVLPGLGLEGMTKVGGTRAIITTDVTNGNKAAETEITLTVDTLPAAATTVTVVCYNNATGQWTTIPNVQVDPITKKIMLKVPGSCTIQILAK